MQYTGIKIINPFTDLEPTVRENLPPRLENLTALSVGVGARAFRVDKSGMWLGAEKWVDAKARFDMDGNAFITGVFSLLSNSLDDVIDGTSYKRVLSTDISAGHILLTETIGTLDSIDNGTSYSKVLTTSISAGKIKLDEVVTGTYGLVASTSISAGKIILTSGTGVSGSLPNASVAGLGGLALKSVIGAIDVDTTIISGGKIITGLLTASNIQTGTLNAIDINSCTITTSTFKTTGTGAGVEIGMNNLWLIYNNSRKITVYAAGEGMSWCEVDGFIIGDAIGTTTGTSSVGEGGSFLAYSSGNDKYVQIYHNDTHGYISTNSGALYLVPNAGRVGGMDVLFFGGMDGTLNATADGQIEMWTNGTLDRFYARLASTNVIVGSA